MKQYVPEAKCQTVSQLNPTDVIGFKIAQNKGFLQFRNFSPLHKEKDACLLVSLEQMSHGDAFGDVTVWNCAIDTLKQMGADIFVFDNNYELLKWLAENN